MANGTWSNYALSCFFKPNLSVLEPCFVNFCPLLFWSYWWPCLLESNNVKGQQKGCEVVMTMTMIIGGVLLSLMSACRCSGEISIFLVARLSLSLGRGGDQFHIFYPIDSIHILQLLYHVKSQETFLARLSLLLLCFLHVSNELTVKYLVSE